MAGAAAWKASHSSGSGLASTITPALPLWMKPAQRLAMLTTLPTRSELTFCTKSSRFRSRSSTPRPSLAA
ncbi:hypothetical protein D3C78_1214770 [compost metagenome]